MKKGKTITLFIGVVLIVSTVLSACQSGYSATELQKTMDAAVEKTISSQPTATQIPTSTPVPTATVTPTQAPVQYGPTNFPANVDPLTGLTVADPATLNRRPVMVKVSNFPREGRPHAGLSKADIVFDYSTGEGANRYLALFYGQDAEQVGPIRSGRYIDQWLVSMYNGVLGMMYAWAPEYNEIVGRLGNQRVINGTTNTCPAICKYDNLGVSEVSWFANTAELSKYYVLNGGSSDKPVLDGMAFNTTPPSGGTDGHDVTMHFGFANEGEFKYDAPTGKYLRWIDNKLSDTTYEMIPQLDRINNQQLAFSNVVILFASYTTLNGDDTMHEVGLVGASGRALIFRDGQVFEAKWKGVNGTGPIQFFDANKQPFELQPGNTWISITGTYSDVEQTEPGKYMITFGKP
jgi:hypothetical protein